MKKKIFIVQMLDSKNPSGKSFTQVNDALFYSNDTDAHLVFLPHEQERFEFNEATVALYNTDDESLVERPAVIETFEGRKSVVLKMTEDLLAHWGRWQAQVVFKKGDKINTSVVVKFDTLRYMLDQRPPTLRDVIKVDELYSQLVTVMDEIVGKDVISAPEIILARGGENTLGERLDKEHNEVIQARGDNPTLGERLENIDNDAKVGSIRTKQRGVSAFEFGVIADGITDDTDAMQSAIDYCLLNKQRLLLPAGNISISKTLNIDTGKGHLNMDGVAGTSDTPLTVLKSQIADGSDIIHAFTTAFSNPTYLSNILIAGTGSDGIGIYADGIKLETQTVRIRMTGAECILLNRSYGSSLKDTQLYKTDGKTVLKFKNTNLTTGVSLITYGIDKSVEPTVVLENAKSTNVMGINVNGQLGLKLIGSFDNNIFGYHEITTIPIASRGNFSTYFDKDSVNNTVKLQTQFPVIDFGYNNSWETLLMSNTRDLINPKLVNDLVDGTFDSDITFPGANNGSFSVVDEPSVYSAKSIKTTLTSTGSKSLYPVNNWQSDMYVHKLTPGKYYIIQFSVKSNLNLIDLYPNGEFDLIVSAKNAVSPKYLSIRNFPVYDEWRTYQLRIQYVGTQSVSSYLEFYVNRLPSGQAPELYVSDYVFIDEDLLKNKKMQKYRNTAPNTGSFLSGTKFEKSNDFGGYIVKESGTFKTISNLIVNTTDSKTARVTTGQVSTLAIGDIVSFSLASGSTQTRIVTGVDAGSNTFTVNSNLNQAREYNVLIKQPVIAES